MSDLTFATSYPGAPGLFILKVMGDSMVGSNGEARFPDGCSIVIDSNLDAVDGDFVVVRRTSNTAALFRRLDIRGGERYLRPLNDRYSESPLGDANIVGVVTKVHIDTVRGREEAPVA